MLKGCSWCHRPTVVNDICTYCGRVGKEIEIRWFDVLNDYSLDEREDIPSLEGYRRLVDSEEACQSKWIHKEYSELHYLSTKGDLPDGAELNV